MIRNDQSLQKLFSSLFKTASAILNCKESDILEYFSGHRLYILDNDDPLRGGKMIEVKLEKAIFDCLINQDDICNTCIIYLENDKTIKDYLNRCTSMYPYEELVLQWGIPDPDMLIGTFNESYYFVLHSPQNEFYN